MERPPSSFVVLFFFILFFSLAAVTTFLQKSPTMDEPIHLAAGYVALVDRDFRVDVTHPPFLRMWAALPLVQMVGVEHNTGTIDRYPTLSWPAQAYAFARDRLYGVRQWPHVSFDALDPSFPPYCLNLPAL